MTQTLFGTKQRMSEAYLGEERVAVTRIDLMPMTVAQVKSVEKDGYTAAQVVFGKSKKHVISSMTGHLKAAGVKGGKIREVEAAENKNVGDTVNPGEIISAGAVVTVQGTSKGKGFAGGVKRWGFHGGPKTHGQSDRHRAPGSIGQGTTPGRVHRGKKMAGRMGSDTVSLKNLVCVAVSGNSIWVTGPVPGATKSLVKVVVTGQKEVPTLSFLNGYEPAKESQSVAPETPIESAPADSKKNEETQE